MKLTATKCTTTQMTKYLWDLAKAQLESVYRYKLKEDKYPEYVTLFRKIEKYKVELTYLPQSNEIVITKRKNKNSVGHYTKLIVDDWQYVFGAVKAMEAVKNG